MLWDELFFLGGEDNEVEVGKKEKEKTDRRRRRPRRKKPFSAHPFLPLPLIFFSRATAAARSAVG